MIRTPLLALAALSALAGCTDKGGDTGRPSCAEGFHMESDGNCYEDGTDGGGTDGGGTDGTDGGSTGGTDGGSTGGTTDGGSTGGSTDGGSTGGTTDGGSTDGGSTDGGTTDGGGLDSWTVTGVTDADGLLAVEVPIEGQRSFLITAIGDTVPVSLEEVYGPDGSRVLHWADWFYSDYSLTYAFFPDIGGVSFNWPVREEDGPLEDGTYTAVFAAYSFDYVPGETVELTVHTNTDDDLSSGRAEVVLIYAEGVDENADVVAAVEDAVDYWETIWAAAGLSLSVRYESSTIPTDVASPGYGDPDPVHQANALRGDDELAVIISETLDGSVWYYGVSGGIPGGLADSDYSAVVISWLSFAGFDGTFDAAGEEMMLMGETLAHEVGHYTGLFHPVEDGFRWYDALDDTPECSSQRECEEVLGENFMYPYSICDMSGCVHATEITSDQAGVMNRYTGIQ